MIRRNQNGQAEVIVTFGLAIIVLLLLAAIISAQTKQAHRIRKVKAKIEALKPVCDATKCVGRYALKRDDDDWYVYTFNIDMSLGDSTKPYAQYGGALPKGGNWTKTEEPDEEEMEDASQDQEVDVSESEDGSPSDSDASSDSSSGDAGSSDSGGGDGGGDGGGGD